MTSNAVCTNLAQKIYLMAIFMLCLTNTLQADKITNSAPQIGGGGNRIDTNANRHDFTQDSQDSQSLTNTAESSKSIIDSSHKSTPISFIYNATLGYLLDNTEETTPFWTPRTLHAISATLEAGFRVDDNLGGAHSIVFGGYGAQFMGATRGFNAGGGIFAYYNYTYANEFNAYFGIFPRSAWIAKYPRSFFREDYLFLHPEINGAMLQYSGESGAIKGYAEATLEHFGADLRNATDEFYALFGREIEIWDLLFFGAHLIL